MTKLTDEESKFPCATCQKLSKCKSALELFGVGKALGSTVMAIGITCPQDGITYRAERRTANG